MRTLPKGELEIPAMQENGEITGEFDPFPRCLRAHARPGQLALRDPGRSRDSLYMMPFSRGYRKTSRTWRLNSGSSSKNKTPWCASDTSLGTGTWPPPIRPTSEMVWCGARQGRVVTTAVRPPVRPATRGRRWSQAPRPASAPAGWRSGGESAWLSSGARRHGSASTVRHRTGPPGIGQAQPSQQAGQSAHGSGRLQRFTSWPSGIR
jgi:hypothetical protein